MMTCSHSENINNCNYQCKNTYIPRINYNNAIIGVH